MAMSVDGIGIGSCDKAQPAQPMNKVYSAPPGPTFIGSSIRWSTDRARRATLRLIGGNLLELLDLLQAE